MAGASGVHVPAARPHRNKPVPKAKVNRDFEKLLGILVEDCAKDKSSVCPAAGGNGQATVLARDLPRGSWLAGDATDGPHIRRDSQSSEKSAETECSEREGETENQLEDSKGADGEDLPGKRKKGNLWKRMKTGLRRTFRRKRGEEKEKDQEESAESDKRGSLIRTLRRSFRRKSKKKDERAVKSEGSTPLRQHTHSPKATGAYFLEEEVLAAVSVHGGGDAEDVPGALPPRALVCRGGPRALVCRGGSRTELQPGPDKFDERFSDIPYMDEVEEEATGEGTDRVDGGRKGAAFTRCGSLEEDGAWETLPSEVDDEPPGNLEANEETLQRIASYVESTTFPYNFESRLGAALRRAGDDADSRGGPSQRELSELEQELLDLMRAEGDNLPHRVQRWFMNTVRRYMGDEHTWSQFHFFLRLSTFAFHSLSGHAEEVSVVTTAALRVFRERFSSWLSSQGGVENMPLDEDTPV